MAGNPRKKATPEKPAKADAAQALPQATELTSDLQSAIKRRFGRHQANCPAVLAFPDRNAHPRLKAHLVQIGKGGCALTTEARVYIGEPCLVWASAGGHKFLGVKGKIVWMKSVYEGHETTVVGVEFDRPIELPKDLYGPLGIKP